MAHYAAHNEEVPSSPTGLGAPPADNTALLRLWMAGLLFFCGVFFGVLAYLDGQYITGTLLNMLSFIGVAYLATHRSKVEPVAIQSSVRETPRNLEVKAIVSAFPEPAILLDKSFFVHAFNSAAEQAFSNLSLGKPLSFAVRVPEILTAVRNAAEGKSTTTDYSERVPKDLWMQVHAAPVPDEKKDGQGFILLSLKDLTPIRHAERMRVDFVANASHELRTPLASLLGFIDTLQGPAKDDAKARERFLGIMQEQSRRMARLVDDLLSLSHLEQKARQRPYGATNIYEVVTQVRDSLQPLAEQKSVAIILKMPEKEYWVTGDRDELVRVIENLVENAIKYGSEGGKVEIEAAFMGLEATEIQVSVRDFGQGIAEEHIPRLTERFYRADTDAVLNKSGTGLGLAIVKHILTRHKGRLSIESQPGKGSLFIITMPARDAIHSNDKS